MLYSSTKFSLIGNVTKRTLRHYNKIDLLKPTKIDDNGYWYYDDKALNRLQVILNLKVLGYTLNEIQANIDSNFSKLRASIPDKKRFVEEQIMQLELAKRLLTNIENKSNLTVINALEKSIEEEHIDWYKRNLSKMQYQLVKEMMSQESAEDEHQRMVDYLQTFKKGYANESSEDMMQAVRDVKDIFASHQLSNQTVQLLIQSFLKSNLEGPLSTRILSIKEVVRFMEVLNQLNNDRA